MMRILIFLIVIPLWSHSPVEKEEKSDIYITRLLCERQVNPNHIDSSSPRISWLMDSEERGQAQTACRILVASSLELLKEGKADYWDSGKIISSDSDLVPYRGRKLKSKNKYYFTVKVWDKNGIPSEYATPGFWEMALLYEEDWQAEWISAPPVFDWIARGRLINQSPKDIIIPEEPMPLFRETFKIAPEKEIESAKAYISGLGFFELYLNGEKAEDHLLAPAFTDYTKTVLYEVLDLKSGLNPGENVLGVMLGNGWYNHISNDSWGFSKAPWIADPALLCQVEIKYTDGSTQQVLSGNTWKCAPGPITFSSLRMGETYDATREITGWSEPDFDEENWQDIRIVRGPEGQLKAQNMPPVRIMKKFSPANIRQTSDTLFLVDFGQNMSGFIRMKASGKKGNKVHFRYGELLSPEGQLDQSNIDRYINNSRFQTDEYIFKGEGMEEWQPRFTYHGFRYVEVSGWEGNLEKDDLTACAIHTDYNSSSKFSCSVPLLNQIQENTLWSFKNNFVNIPTDCPHREKNGWTGDAHLASDAGLYNFDMLTSYEKWLNDLMDAQKPSGLLPGIAPTSGWGYDFLNGPDLETFAMLKIPWNLYLYEGNIKIIADIYPAVKKYLGFLDSKSKEGIISWGDGDWVPVKTKTPVQITSTATYYQDLIIASKMASILGKKEDQSFFREKAKEVKKAFNHSFINSATGEMTPASQTGLGCALYMEVADSLEREKLAAQLKDLVICNDLNLDFGALGSKYVPNALSDYGYPEMAFNMINTTKYPGWGYFVEQGATTLWESWDGKMYNASSRNHVLFGDVSAWFYKNLAGIKPDEKNPGFKHFFIEPYLASGLDWIKCIKYTAYGDIVVNWNKGNENVTLELKIPVNTSASLLLPAGYLTTDGKLPETGKAGIEQVETIRQNKVKLGSGTYKFNLKMKQR